MAEVFDFMEGLDLPPSDFYADQQAAIESSVLADLEEDRDNGFITAEDCEALYAGWVKKYRGQHPRPEFKIA